VAIKGMVGAVYQNNTAPISDNIALILNWTLEVEHRKGFTYGPELHAVSTGWSVKAEAYGQQSRCQKGKPLSGYSLAKVKTCAAWPDRLNCRHYKKLMGYANLVLS